MCQALMRIPLKVNDNEPYLHRSIPGEGLIKKGSEGSRRSNDRNPFQRSGEGGLPQW